MWTLENVLIYFFKGAFILGMICLMVQLFYDRVYLVLKGGKHEKP